MAIKDYAYSIAIDTLNHKVDVNKLSKEIKASTISIGEDNINIFGNTLTIYMKDTLVVSDETILDTIVSQHDGIPEIEVIAPTNEDGTPIVTHTEPMGESGALPTHDFTDRTTWYTLSERVTNEVPTLNSGTTYDLVNMNIIDAYHGKITRENHLESIYAEVVYDDGVVIPNTEYSVNYDQGTLTLDNTPSGVLTIDYSYENGSSFIVEPKSGCLLKVKDAEIQFTKDVVMIPVEFEIWVFNPSFDVNLAESPSNPLRIKLADKSDVYKGYKDIINIAKQGTGKIDAIPGFTFDIMVFPFHYDRVITLKSSLGMQLRVRLVDETPMTGEWGTITFYVVKEIESA